MDIIIDRNKKRWSHDLADDDMLGLKENQRRKLNELPISDKEDNPVDKWLLQNPPKSLIGKKAYALRDNEIMGGWIVDIYCSRHLLVKGFKDKINRPIEFSAIISIEKKRSNG